MSFKPFTKRVLSHPRIQAHPKNPESSDDSLVLAIKDELLVSQSLVGAVTNLLADRKIASTALTTVFRDRPPLGGEDVAVLQLTLPPGLDIFQVTDYLRSDRQLKGKERNVSPNHVLIPASNGDQCPFGAPSQFKGKTPPVLRPALARKDEFQPVFVVDSGYQWGPANWGRNPLETRGRLTSVQAEYYKPDLLSLVKPPPTVWTKFSSDVLSANQPNVLDHLAGHANFVAGVIARRCTTAEITVWNHNGAFVSNNPDNSFMLSTEAVALYSLSVIPRDPPAVINFGFAFLPFGSSHLAWDSTLQAIFRSGGVVVAPAGNQSGSRLERCPASLTGVIGVASLDTDVAKPSDFSNLGNWVTCSAIGRDVVSTFLHVKMKVEEGGFGKRDFTSNWAVWSGTSFAAPKVAAAIAGRANGGTPAEAWDALKQAHIGQQHPELGIAFTEQDLV